MAGLTGRRSSSTRGAGKFGFKSEQHPRTHDGRFTFSNHPTDTNKVGRGEVRQVSRQAGKLVKGVRESADINRAKVDLLKEMSREQRQKLFTVVSNKTQNTLSVTGKSSRVPIARPVSSRDSVTFVGDKLHIWHGKPESKYQGDFKVKVLRNFEYKVQHNGSELVLNRNGNSFKYQGEHIYGLPSLHPKLREMKPESLFRDLAVQMGYVEHSGSIAPPAPEWKPTFHGSISDKSLVRSAKGAGNYGGMQIHHVNQWTKRNFDEITGKVDRGEMSLNEAKVEMRTLLRPFKTVVNSKGESVTKYEINVADKGHRQLVILPAGVHDINSPLYDANHPKGYHPDTGRLTKFAIPDTGLGGRDEFNKFRAGFWTEVYRRESFILAGEINRRINKGELTLEQAQQHWSDAHDQAHKSYKTLLTLKNK